MKKTVKGIIAFLLAVSMLMGFTVVAFAANGFAQNNLVVILPDRNREKYISDLRLIYANSYQEAVASLNNSRFKYYYVLEENLNSGTEKTGVWLAYNITYDINDAITDLSVMQMGGGYNEGNYKQMIQKSKNDYIAMGEIYVQAIDYFAEAYTAGNFLAESAYRQLNVYAGVDVYTKDRLGDLFLEGALTANDLATLFMQGNVHVLENIRSLLAMGVSYNEEGLTYLQRVSLLASGTYSGYLDESAADVTADDIYISDSESVDVLAALIAPNINTFRAMFEELSAYEDELNYEDEEFTDLEIKYAEYMAIAQMMRAVDYLGGQSLYDFCLNYTVNSKDYSALYPLARALNEGQIALTKVGHFYDVVRYSMSDAPEAMITEQLDELEAQFEEKPFNVYAGVDRDIYNGTFAVTSAAYRADAYTDSMSLVDALFGNGAWLATGAQIAAGAVGAGLFAWAIVRSVKGHMVTTEKIANLAGDKLRAAATDAGESLGKVVSDGNYLTNTGVLKGAHLDLFNQGLSEVSPLDFDDFSMSEKLDYLLTELSKHQQYTEEGGWLDQTMKIHADYNDAYNDVMLNGKKYTVTSISWAGRIFTGALYVAGALSMAYSAISLYNQIKDYYHPAYDVIPEAMVDMIKTADGDRYIKYDVVTEITMKDGAYPAGDLNAFSAQRWNALYFTKSYEAGKPLLADFVLSNVSNRPEENYLALHRFGEKICYDLNKYNFSDKSDSIFLSVKQSNKEKSAVADVPDVIGSLFGNGAVFLVGGLGLAFGIGGTIGLQSILKKKKKGSDGEKATA